MDYLWAPWRIKFILENAKKSDKDATCIFCDLCQVPAKENYILYRHPLAYIVLNIYPYTTGHLLIIPNRHTQDLAGLSVAEHQVLGQLMGESIRILGENMKAQGFNIGMNIGRVGGAGIPNHLHYHVVPRWSGDSNFMPVIAETRTMPESLEGVYERLEPSFKALRLEGSA